MNNLTGFAEACYNQNSINELLDAIKAQADVTDLKTWGITEDEYFQCLHNALESMRDSYRANVELFFNTQLNKSIEFYQHTDVEILELQLSTIPSDVDENYCTDTFFNIQCNFINDTKCSILDNILSKIDYNNLSSDELAFALEQYMDELTLINDRIFNVIIKHHQQCKQCNDMNMFNKYDIFKISEDIEQYNHLMSL